MEFDAAQTVAGLVYLVPRLSGSQLEHDSVGFVGCRADPYSGLAFEA